MVGFPERCGIPLLLSVQLREVFFYFFLIYIKYMEQRLLVGLGNFGQRFEMTRHNLGIMVLRAWVEKMKMKTVVIEWKEVTRWSAEVAQVRLPETKIWGLFPLTMMNDSGRAVKLFLSNNGSVAANNILVLCDDLDLALGEISYVSGGSARGHNGVRSVHSALATVKIPQLRLGIGRPEIDQPIDKYVLGRFNSEEQKHLGDQINRAVEAIDFWIEGIDLGQSKMFY